MTDDPWTIRSTAEGWQLYYDGNPWPMEPKATDQEAAAYLERVRKRYRGDSARLWICPSHPASATPDTEEGNGEP